MAYTIVITKEAKKDIDVLDSVVKKQLYKKLIYFKNIDDIQTVAKKLINPELGGYRLRVGDYRIVFDMDRRTLILLRIQHRKDVYR